MKYVSVWFWFVLAVSLPSLSSAQIVSNSTFPFISDQLDAFFAQFGVSIEIILAIGALILGVVLAIFGALDRGKALTAFVAGSLLGCFFAAILLESINSDIDLEIWVSVFFLTGIIVGLICACVGAFAKILLGLALGISFTGLLLQTGLAGAISAQWVVIVILAISCIIGVIIACKVIDIVFALLASFLAGSFLILGVGYFTNSEVSLNALVADVSVVTQCSDSSCITPLVIGVMVTTLSLFINLRRYCKKKKADKKKIDEQQQQSDELVNEMRQNRERYEKRLNDIQQSNEEVLRELNKEAGNREKNIMENMNSTLQRTQDQQAAELSRIEEALVKQQHEMSKQQQMAMAQQEELKKEIEKANLTKKEELEKMEEIERLKLEKEEKIKAMEIEKAELLKQIQENKSDLEIELDRERLQMEEREAEIQRQQEREERERAKLDEEEDMARRAAILELQEEARLNKVRISEMEAEVKETQKLEKRLKLHVDTESDELSLEMAERATEFAKFKALVKRTRAMQKDSLKHVQSAIKDVEKLGNNLRKESKKNLKKSDPEEVKKAKEKGLQEMQARMETVRRLLERYEANTSAFKVLIEDMMRELEEFKKAQDQLEAYGDTRVDVREGEEINENEGVEVQADEILQGTVVPPGIINRRNRAAQREQRQGQDLGTADLFDELLRYLRFKRSRWSKFLGSKQ